MMKDGDNVLLHLLRQKCGCTVEDVRSVLLEAGEEEAQSHLVNSKCIDGFTPLMLAVGGGGGFGNKKSRDMTAVARFLLSKGAVTTLSAHSAKRRTAADYAELHKKPWLAKELRELEMEHNSKLQLLQQQQQQSLQDTETQPHRPGDVAIQMPGEKYFRCRLCGDRLGGCKFRRAHQDVESGAQTNPLIVHFFSDAGLGSSAAIRETLAKPSLHNFNARKRFTKELTEVLGMVSRLQRIVSASGRADESWHVIDLCCGKGFLATLTAICFPSFVVTAVDKLIDAYLPHYEAAGIDNVRYSQLDVMSPGFPDEMARLARDENHGDGRPVVIMGMHLCGLLSVRALELLRKVPGVRGVVIAPCCLPCQKLSEDTPPSIYEGTDNWEKFTRWCDFLEARMKQEAEEAWLERPDSEPNHHTEDATEASDSHCFSRETDDGIMSEKRILLSALLRRQKGCPST
jgi:hypothetical protein